MEQKITVPVPAIHTGLEANRVFKEQYVDALSKAEAVDLDFQFHAAVSSMTLGTIMYGIRDHRSKIRFINLSDYLVDSLKTIIGPLADGLIAGPVRKLDIELHKGSGD